MKALPEHVVGTAAEATQVVADGGHVRLQAPPGGGKTSMVPVLMTMSILHGRRVFYLVERRQTAERIVRELCVQELPAGLYRGHDPRFCDEHRDLTGEPSNILDRGCGQCRALDICEYGQRDAVLEDLEIVVGTHDAMIYAMQRTPARFQRCVIIIDEDLHPYEEYDVTIPQIEGARAYLGGIGQHAAVAGLAAVQKLLAAKAAASGYCRLVKGDDWTGLLSAAKPIHAALYGPDLQQTVLATADGGAGRLPPAVELLRHLTFILRQPLDEDTRLGALHTDVHKVPELLLRRDRARLPPSIFNRSQIVILSATTELSLTRYPTQLQRVVRIGTRTPTGTIRLHVTWGANTRTRINRGAGEEAIAALGRLNVAPTTQALVVTSKSERSDNSHAVVRAQVAQRLEIPEDQVVHMTRGALRGENDARECTVVYLGDLPLFTTVEDYLLSTAMHSGRSLSRQALMKKARPGKGTPNLAHGYFRHAGAQLVQRRKALDEFVQTVYRGALRHGEDVDVVAILPHPSIIRDLLLAGYTKIEFIKPEGRSTIQHARFDQLAELVLWAFSLSPGTVIQKNELAMRAGYPTFESGKDVLKKLLEGIVVFKQHRVVRR